MITLNHALQELVRSGLIDNDEAMSRAIDKDAMTALLLRG
jgi:Tfp pilus assembly pilus retraction ATPase PilT